MSQTHCIDNKVMQIIALFRQNLDSIEIAQSLQFTDHRQMADYMRINGYIWNPEKKNYELMETNQSNSSKDLSEPGNHSYMETSGGESFADVIAFLKTHKEIIMELCSTHAPIPQLPRYVVPGVYTTKSVYMNHNFDLLARQFSEEKNISQRDIFEIALIDFFKKYGYHGKVKALINTATTVARLVAVFAICLML